MSPLATPGSTALGASGAGCRAGGLVGFGVRAFRGRASIMQAVATQAMNMRTRTVSEGISPFGRAARAGERCPGGIAEATASPRAGGGRV